MTTRTSANGKTISHHVPGSLVSCGAGPPHDLRLPGRRREHHHRGILWRLDLNFLSRPGLRRLTVGAFLARHSSILDSSSLRSDASADAEDDLRPSEGSSVFFTAKKIFTQGSPSAQLHRMDRVGRVPSRRRLTGHRRRKAEDQRENAVDRHRLLVTTRGPPPPPGRLFCGCCESARSRPLRSLTLLRPAPSSCRFLHTSLTAAIAPRLPLAQHWMATLFLLIVRRPPRAFRDLGRCSVAPALPPAASPSPPNSCRRPRDPPTSRQCTGTGRERHEFEFFPGLSQFPKPLIGVRIRSPLFRSVPSFPRLSRSPHKTRAPRSLSLGTNQTHSWRKS